MSEKIKFMTDTASDIPDQALREYGIEMLSIPIAVDGEGFYERRDFSMEEFYAVLAKAKEIPATSRIPTDDFVRAYRAAYESGHTHIINVTINAGGSGCNASAHMAKDAFFEETPEARDKIEIHIVDSRSYAIAFGWPVIEGARMARAGKSCAEILAYMDDYFSRVEIYLGVYTLEYAKKSGRIGAASAFVGDVLGLRPIISLIDGETKTEEKVRGEKNLVPKMLELYRRRRQSPDDPVLVVRGENHQYGEELKALFEQELGREVPYYQLGAAISINSGPRAVAFVCLGEKRERPSGTN